MMAGKVFYKHKSEVVDFTASFDLTDMQISTGHPCIQ